MRAPITPSTLLHLHALAQGGTSGDAGVFKRHNNEINELLPSGERRVRFIPVPPDEVLHVLQPGAACWAHPDDAMHLWILWIGQHERF